MTCVKSLAAAAVLAGVALLAAPAFAIQTIHIPDSSTPNNGAPPDGLFDNSVPATWQKKQDPASPSQQGGFHFSVSSGSSVQNGQDSAYDAARKPGSEFYQPLPGYSPNQPR